MENIKYNLFEFEVGTDGIGILSINQVNNPTNLFSTEFITSYIELANKVVADKSFYKKGPKPIGFNPTH